MGQLRYNKRTYFRSSQSDAESFRPYFLAIMCIVFLTFVAVGIQNLVISGNAFGESTSEPLSAICKEDLLDGTCPNTKITLQSTNYFDLALSLQRAHNATN